MTLKTQQNAPEVFYGAPISNSTELIFLNRVRRYLSSKRISSVILANFHLGTQKRQIDFIIATPHQSVVVELKGYRRPVSGTENGIWTMKVGASELPIGFPYNQALNNRYEVSDALRAKSSLHGDLRDAITGMLCIYPEIQPDSSVPATNKKLSVGDFDALVALLQTSAKVSLPLSIWKDFASSMNLVSDAELAQAEDGRHVAKYLSNFLELAELALVPHIEAEQDTDEGLVPLPSLLPLVKDGVNIHLFGPSGSGKSHELSRLVVAAGQAGIIPIAIAARDFEGQLLPLLKVAIARASTVPFNTLIRAAQQTGRTILLCVDALNECAIGRQTELLAALQTVTIRYGVSVVLTGQALPVLPASLQGEVFKIAQPSELRRRQLVEAHAGRSLTENELSILELVGSAQDAAVLAETLNRCMNIDGRFQLYYAFTGDRLAGAKEKVLLHSALGNLAALMREEYTSKVPQYLVVRSFERETKLIGYGYTYLDEAVRAGLLVNEKGSVRFRHDLIGDFFASDHILRTSDSIEDLTRLVERPINEELREFILGGASTHTEIKALLDANIGMPVIDAALVGRCGTSVRRMMIDRCRDVIDKIEFLYGQLVFELPLDGQELPNRSQIVFPKQFEFSLHEQRAAAALSTAIFTDLFNPIMKMLRKVDSRLITEARRLRSEQPNLQRNISALVFGGLYGVLIQPSGCKLLRNLFDAIKMNRIMRLAPKCDIDVNKMLDKFEQLSPGQLFLLLSMHRAQLDQNSSVPLRTAELIPTVWKTGIYHLRLELLDLIVFSGGTASEKQKAEIEKVLNSYLSDNPWMNTFLIDAISAVGKLDFGISVESIKDELKDIAKQPPIAEIAARACSAYTATYDHPARDVFCEAFNEHVSSEVRTAVLVRVIADISIDSMTLAFAIGDLGKWPSIEAIPYLKKLSTAPVSETASPQSSVAVFCEAISQLARLGEPLEVESELSDILTLRAWQLVRPLIYALNITPTPDDTKFERLWEAFATDNDSGTMDVIYRTMMDSRFFLRDSRIDFIDHCAEGLRSICLEVLQPNYFAETIFKSESDRNLIENHRRFAFSCLAEVARSSDKFLIEQWCEDACLGADAIKTLRIIEGR